MIGVYDYTVILTYLSLISASCGIVVATAGAGHPYIGGFFLLFCGLCDTFDGMVARSKKNRTDREKSFGVQIDSLSDLVAFGVLPAMIAVGLLNREGSPIIPFPKDRLVDWFSILSLIVVIFYILAAMIRLAYFNALDEEKRCRGVAIPSGYVGLPVTTAALIFPTALLMNYFIPKDLSKLYLLFLVITGFLFLGKFRVKKPGKRLLATLLSAGAAIFVLLLLMLLFG